MPFAGELPVLDGRDCGVEGSGIWLNMHVAEGCIVCEAGVASVGIVKDGC